MLFAYLYTRHWIGMKFFETLNLCFQISGKFLFFQQLKVVLPTQAKTRLMENMLEGSNWHLLLENYLITAWIQSQLFLYF